MSYWETRQEQAYKAGELTVNEYFKNLEKAFNTAKRKLRQVISDFYTEYANENGLSYADAQKALSKAEIGELKDFIDLAMENIGKVNQEVNNMSIKARVTRYEALESQIDALLRELYAIDYESKAKESMRTIYRDSYYRTWYNIDKYNGFHKEFAQVEPRVIDQLIQYPFNGKNFSDRLWKQKDHLQEQLMESVTTMLVQGKPPQNLASEFAKKLDAKKMDAYRLLHTESSYLMSEATHAGYQEDGVEQYQILATLDSKTCGVCGKLDGKIYPVSEAVTGKNKPPFHPFCRCTDVPYYPDTPTEGRTRTARDENGKNIEVPADMTYEEWKEKYLKAKTDEKKEETAYNFREITGEIPKETEQTAKVVTVPRVTVDGRTYAVDGVNVVQNHSEREKEVAELLSQKLGSLVQLIPEVHGYYTRVKTPDYMIDGEKFDLKELTGASKDAIRNAIHKKQKQADNFVIDISKCSLSLENINDQAEKIFQSYNTEFVNMLILIKDNDVLRILQRTK